MSMDDFRPTSMVEPEVWCRDESFLEDCPPKIGKLYRFWRACCGTRAMPTRSEMSPCFVSKHLPNLLVVNVEPPRNNLGSYRYRFIGASEIALRWADPTARLVEDSYFGRRPQALVAGFERVRRDRGFLCRTINYNLIKGAWISELMINLPISDDGHTVSQIMAYSAPYKPGRARVGLGL